MDGGRAVEDVDHVVRRVAVDDDAVGRVSLDVQVLDVGPERVPGGRPDGRVGLPVEVDRGVAGEVAEAQDVDARAAADGGRHVEVVEGDRVVAGPGADGERGDLGGGELLLDVVQNDADRATPGPDLDGVGRGRAGDGQDAVGQAGRHQNSPLDRLDQWGGRPAGGGGEAGRSTLGVSHVKVRLQGVGRPSVHAVSLGVTPGVSRPGFRPGRLSCRTGLPTGCAVHAVPTPPPLLPTFGRRVAAGPWQSRRLGQNAAPAGGWGRLCRRGGRSARSDHAGDPPGYPPGARCATLWA